MENILKKRCVKTHHSYKFRLKGLRKQCQITTDFWSVTATKNTWKMHGEPNPFITYVCRFPHPSSKRFLYTDILIRTSYRRYDTFWWGKSTCPWSVTLREKVALQSHFVAGYQFFLKGVLGFCLQPFQRGYHHLVHHISHLEWREKEKNDMFYPIWHDRWTHQWLH